VASYYVYSGAVGAADGTTWADAYTTVVTAVSGKSAGDTFYIADDHAESTAGNVVITSPGTAASPCRFLCVDRGGSVPPVSADLATTGTIASSTGDVDMRGESYWYGLSFEAAAVISIGVGGGSCPNNVYEDCQFIGPSFVYIRLSPGHTTWINCDYEANHVDSAWTIEGAWFEWRGGTVSGSALPNYCFQIGNYTENFLIEGVDLSAFGGGKTLFNLANRNFNAILKDCKLGAGVTVMGSIATPSHRVDLIRCDSGATNYRTERYRYQGTLTTETTIVRTGGATDGTTPIAWKIITTANPEWQSPFEAYPISIWSETTGSPVTVTVEGTWGGGAVPLTDEVWMDVEYLGNASYPQGSFVTTTKADILATGASLPAGSGGWAGSTTAFKLTASVTPQMKGLIKASVKVAKVSSTFYIDPKITLT
jgi:hypothetical protein